MSVSRSEFDLISSFIAPAAGERDDVSLAIGDDCAILKVPEGKELAVTIDTLVAGKHFFRDCDPYLVGHKALAVNLSDLAAMGAEPAWATLALTLPEADTEWLEAFMHGFSDLASSYNVQLVGGDTTSGALTISVQVHGFVTAGSAMQRSGAQPGDLIYVSGYLGDAALAVAMIKEKIPVTSGLDDLRLSLEQPQPRVELGLALQGVARSAIDLSDGLSGDLGHICEASGCGATVSIDSLPLSETFARCADWRFAVSGGDDYELCFTVKPESRHLIERIGEDLDCRLTEIGVIKEEQGLVFIDHQGEPQLAPCSYDQFKEKQDG